MPDHDSAGPFAPAPLHVGKPNVGDREAFLARVGEMFDRGWLTNNGPLVLELEERLARYFGVRHCLTVCNGTIALDLAVRGLGLTGEAIVPSMTFIASAHSLQWHGVTPIFCDIDPRTYCIDPDAIEALITPRTTAIMGVHLYGRPCATGRIQAIADRHGLKVVYDAAHAMGCSHEGRMIGNFGDCEVFSFHATKVFNSFEGGAITTNDDALAERIRTMRNFGFAGEDNVVALGTNGKMNEICAAMGLTNLDSLDRFIATNRANLELYRERLAHVDGIDVIEYDTRERNNFHYAILEIDAARFGASRDALQAELKAHGVLARRYFHPGCHRMEPYRTQFPDAGARLPVTERFSNRVLALPNGMQVSAAAVEGICRTIGDMHRRARG